MPGPHLSPMKSESLEVGLWVTVMRSQAENHTLSGKNWTHAWEGGFQIPKLVRALTATTTCWFCCCCPRIPQLPLRRREPGALFPPIWPLKCNMAVSCAHISQHPATYLSSVNSSPVLMPLSVRPPQWVVPSCEFPRRRSHPPHRLVISW